jgi:hypothetical protein
MAQPSLLDFQPGTQRDGTKLDGNRFIDALWCRWRLGRPRKMGGYRQITDTLNGIPRRVHIFYRGDEAIIHVGTQNGIQQVIVDPQGNLISMADRTPVGFPAGVSIGWTLDAIFDTTTNVVQLVGLAVPNQEFVASQQKNTPYIGQIDIATPLAPFSNPNPPSGTWVQPELAGGVVVVPPFVFGFDIDGFLQWSAPNLPLYLGVSQGSTGAGNARISAQKIIAGSPLRGGGAQSPAAVFWSLSEVISATFIGGPAQWAFNTVSPSASILSTAAIIEYDTLYFWAAVDRFLVFNGTVVEVPNAQNQDWFFDNLTPGFESQTFAFKVPRYGEIWWCACMFGSTVPNYAAIFNVRENCWYDTALPNGGRSAGYFAQGLKFPVMAGSVAGPNGFSLWQHEVGLDQVVGADLTAIRSFFETGWFGGLKSTPPSDQGISFHQFEPDLQQAGDLQAWLIGAANARSPEVQSEVITIPGVPGGPQEQFASFTPKILSRLLRLHVESDALGGNYIAGRNVQHSDPAAARLFS